ncbi:hypothetical protein LEN26_003611 [Aphanomyces euteiches]|nr:hypothetical protein AeMF1_003145 [Aphanomyces euteiches]KAH9153038.1 hypothetical protein LEN26_003611 [Aphanomyces euteiches]KAH9188314.1 hypothetical protein AeNC1_009711 [Aphanomyces euteiches]
MLNIFCAVLSEENPFPIDVDPSITVGAFKKYIAEEIEYTGRARFMKLFLAVKDGVWLDYDNLKSTTHEEFSELNPTWMIGDYFKSDPPTRKVHVLIVIPGMVKFENDMKKPHLKRKERWDQLNEILDQNKKKSRHHDSTGYSYVSWSDVQDVFQTTKYVQPHRPIPDALLNFLAQYLSYATTSLQPITLGTEAQRLHVIAPILICVCFLFGGDVVIEVEKNLTGDYVMAHGHFEFVLRRGNKQVCIVEAKQDNLMQGMAQNLLGCEVAAEVNDLDVVYGIVSNYVQWNFLRSSNDKIELEECALDIGDNGPSLSSLGKICGKIYAMLSDD